MVQTSWILFDYRGTTYIIGDYPRQKAESLFSWLVTSGVSQATQFEASLPEESQTTAELAYNSFQKGQARITRRLVRGPK